MKQKRPYPKIKLPRKRKKAYKKAHSDPTHYMGMQISNEVLYENNPCKEYRKFPELKVVGNKIITLFYW